MSALISARAVRLAVLMLVLSLLANVPILAQAENISETFDDPALPGWEQSPQATIADGVLHLEPGGFIHHPGNWGDAEISLRVRRQGGHLVVSHHVGPAGSYHIVLIEDGILVQREVGGAVQPLVDGPLSVPLGEWLELSLTLEGGQQTVRINGEIALTATDPEPLPPGGFSLEVVGPASIDVDDLFLTVSGTQPVPSTITDLTWMRTGGPLGGLGYDIRMRSDEPDTLYVTDAWAGVFMSSDGGQAWVPINAGISTRVGETADAIPVFCLTVDPHDNDTIWLGTQNVRGIYKSTDGGQNWQQMDNGVVEREGITFRGFTVDPQLSDTVYAAAEISSWVWAGEERMGREFDLTRGVVYKTTNGGQNWTAVWRGENLARYIWIDPRDSNVVYVSTGIFDREAANSDPDARRAGGVGIVKSTDGGQTWSQVNNGLNNLYVGTLFMHPTNPDILLAGTGSVQYYDNDGVYISADGGASWQQTLIDDVITAVEFSTQDPQIAYAASSNRVYRSTDGGYHWQRVSGDPEQGWGSPGVRAGFPIDLQIDPRNSDRIFANNYGGGNFLSTDGGQTWIDASRGYTGAQVRDIAVNPAQPGRVFAAARSGLFGSGDGGSTWTGLSFPPQSTLEWYVVAVDPADSQHILAGNNWSGVLLSSPDEGRTWREASAPLGSGKAFRAIVFAPGDPSTVYAGSSAFWSAGTFSENLPASGVFVSHDGGSSWSPSNDATSQDANVTALAVSPDDPQIVVAATGNRGVLKTTDGGASWQSLALGVPEDQPVLSVAISPTDINVLYVGLGFGGILRSADGGASWQQSGIGLDPAASVSDIIFTPGNPQVMVAADRMSGVYRSEDGGATWMVLNSGLLNRAVNALSISGDGLYLYAATEGGGVFRLDFDGAPPPGTVLPQPATTEDGGQTGGEEAEESLAQPSAEPGAGIETTQSAESARGRCPASFVPLAALPLTLVLIRRRARKTTLGGNALEGTVKPL